MLGLLIFAAIAFAPSPQRLLELVSSSKAGLVSDTNQGYAHYAEMDVGEEARAKFTALVTALYQHLFAGTECSDRDLDAFDERATAFASDHARP